MSLKEPAKYISTLAYQKIEQLDKEKVIVSLVDSYDGVISILAETYTRILRGDMGDIVPQQLTSIIHQIFHKLFNGFYILTL